MATSRTFGLRSNDAHLFVCASGMCDQTFPHTTFHFCWSSCLPPCDGQHVVKFRQWTNRLRHCLRNADGAVDASSIGNLLEPITSGWNVSATWVIPLLSYTCTVISNKWCALARVLENSGRPPINNSKSSRGVTQRMRLQNKNTLKPIDLRSRHNKLK